MAHPYMPAVMDEYGVHRVLAVNECGGAIFRLRDAGAPTIPPAHRTTNKMQAPACPNVRAANPNANAVSRM